MSSDGSELKSVAERVAYYCNKSSSGCLHIKVGIRKGVIYIQKGRVADAEYSDKRGISALYDLMTVQEPVMNWMSGQTTSQITMDLDMGRTQKLAENPHTAASSAAKEPSGLMEQHYIQLDWDNPGGQSASFRLDKKGQASYVIGRAPDCQVVVDDASVESIHCTLLVQDDIVELWDLGTDNKTSINGLVVAQAVLNPGDRIRLGSAELIFQLKLRRGVQSAFAQSAQTTQAVGRSTAREVAKTPVKIPLPPLSEANTVSLKAPITYHSLQQKKQKDEAAQGLFSRFFEKKRKS